MPYCSLSCYRVPSHQDCSEAFYREQVRFSVGRGVKGPEDVEKIGKIIFKSTSLIYLLNKIIPGRDRVEREEE